MKIILLIGCVLLPCLSFATGSEDDPTGSCPMQMRAMELKPYITELQKTELTKKQLKEGEHRLMDHLATLTAGRASLPQIQQSIREYSGAVSSRVRGLIDMSEEYVQTLGRELKIPVEVVRRSVEEASDDPIIYRPSSMAEFILRNRPTIETVLLTLLTHEKISQLKFSSMEHEGQLVTQATTPGPRQIEMIRTALQYSMTRPGHRVLELGYGNPTVALGYATFTGTKVTSVDYIKPPHDANETLSPFGVDLVQGQFPDAPGLVASLKTKGPFSLVMALDTVKNDPSVLVTKASPSEFAKAIYDLLEDGGVVVLMNDFAGEPYFTKNEAQAAGFKIIRWGFPEFLPPDLIQFVPYSPNALNAGTMAIYVLHKGNPRSDLVVKSRGQ